MGNKHIMKPHFQVDSHSGWGGISAWIDLIYLIRSDRQIYLSLKGSKRVCVHELYVVILMETNSLQCQKCEH